MAFDFVDVSVTVISGLVYPQRYNYRTATSKSFYDHSTAKPPRLRMALTPPLKPRTSSLFLDVSGSRVSQKSNIHITFHRQCIKETSTFRSRSASLVVSSPQKAAFYDLFI